jgi:hypothetical protein
MSVSPWLKDFETVDYTPFDPIVKRTEGTVRCKSTAGAYTRFHFHSISAYFAPSHST